MAGNEASTSDEDRLVESKSFSNMKVSENFQAQFDKTLGQIKTYAESHLEDKVANEFVTRLGKLDGYTIHDGSTDKDCTGEHNGKQKTLALEYATEKGIFIKESQQELA